MLQWGHAAIHWRCWCTPAPCCHSSCPQEGAQHQDGGTPANDGGWGGIWGLHSGHLLKNDGFIRNEREKM